MLDTAVRGIDNLGALEPALRQLADRHVAYGVKDEHYAVVGAALLTTLQQGLGDGFTPAVRDAWTQTYGAITGVMTARH
jgi:hemoglobin-like flavoprotein